MHILAGWLDPKTQRATAFYALLGILCSHIYYHGLDQWDVVALALLTGVGTASGLLVLLNRSKPPVDPPGGRS